MNYNIHPIFVHFPIALLTVYGLLELLRFRKLKNQPSWFLVKAVLLILGTVSAYVTLQTGDIARHLITDRSLRPLISMHEQWAKISTLIFSLLAAGYLAKWIDGFKLGFLQGGLLGAIWKLGMKIEWLVIETPLVWILALAGIASMLVTGALGGTIVYGAGRDPFTDFIYHLFFK